MSDIPAEWPKSGPYNADWNLDAAAFVKLVQECSCLWHKDSALKYLDIRIDTRDGGFVLYDRDHNFIDPERVLRALAKETET